MVTEKSLLVVDVTNNYIENIYDTKEQATVACAELNQKTNKYNVVDFVEYRKTEKAKWVTGIVREITEDAWWYALEVLPPMRWRSNGIVESFLMSEYMSGPYTEQYYRLDDRHYVKMVDATDSSTEITIEQTKTALPIKEETK